MNPSTTAQVATERTGKVNFATDYCFQLFSYDVPQSPLKHGLIIIC